MRIKYLVDKELDVVSGGDDSVAVAMTLYLPSGREIGIPFNPAVLAHNPLTEADGAVAEPADPREEATTSALSTFVV